MGVISHRVEVKQAAGRVERLLERTVEPLWALHGGNWPASFLEQAWRRVVENSAHDSICACSAEPTVAQVLLRFAEAEQIGAGLVQRLLDDLGTGVARRSFLVLNPSPVVRTDLVTLDVPLPVDAADDATVRLLAADSSEVPTQDLGLVRTTVREATLDASEVIPYLRRRMHARELYGHQVNGYRVAHVEPTDGVHELTIDVELAPDPDELDVDELLERLAEETALDPGSRWHLAVVRRPHRRLHALATVPALGWSTLTPATDARPRTATPAPARPVVASEGGLSNGLVSVAVADDGTLTISGAGQTVVGVGRIVDGGDVGDSYNYAPPPDDTIVDRPVRTAVVAGRSGPLVADLLVRREYDWPVGLLDDLSARTPETVRTPVEMTVEVRANEPFVRLGVELDNRSRDHRVRFHLPLGGGAERSFAEGQFAIVERGLEMEGGHGEVPLPTFPAHGFVVAGPLAVLLEHVVEYELVERGGDRASELALTLVRATGLISRDNHPYRDEPAGPVIAAPSGQAQGVRRVAFAVMPTAVAGGDPATLAAAERFRHPLLAAPGLRPGAPANAERPGLTLTGDGIVLSSLRRRPGADLDDVLEVRLVREADGDGRARIDGAFGRAREVDLLGRPTGDWSPVPGRLELSLGGWEIRTIQLEPTRS
jgi:alpha-mannosidase